MITLKTWRLLLAPWREEDAEALYALASDPEIGPMCGWEPHGSVEESREVIRDVFSAPEVCAILSRESGALLGAGGLTRAYTKGAADALTAAGIARMGLWTLWDVPCTYPLLERMKLEVAATGGVVRDAEYGADITLRTAFPAGAAETFQLRLTELSAGSLTMTAAGEEFLPGPREEAN